MKMNRKGFTLVELIAMMVVLGILMVITVPNISGILNKNKDSITKEDINKMVAGAKTKIQTKEAKYPANVGECVIMSLGFVDSNNDLNKGINDGTYSKTKSFVLINKTNASGAVVAKEYTYNFYIRLVEENQKKGRQYGLGIISYEEFVANPGEYMPDARTSTSINSDKDLSTTSDVKRLIGDSVSSDSKFKTFLGCTGNVTVYQ